ncbi:SgcJ/EcaC family oxidoreductase [Streptomyces olivoreticuli]
MRLGVEVVLLSEGFLMKTVQQPGESGFSGQEEEIADVVARYETAFNQNDTRAMNSLFSPDAIFVNFSGNLVFGADRLYQAQSFVFANGGPLADIAVRYTIESIVFLTPEVGVAHARQRSAGADGQMEAGRDPMAGILTMTLMRDAAGEWHIRLAQNTPVVAQ